MTEPYVTVTLELSGYDEGSLLSFHAHLRTMLKEWRSDLTYGELTIAYQDQAQIEADAQVEAEADEDTWYEG